MTWEQKGKRNGGTLRERGLTWEASRERNVNDHTSQKILSMDEEFHSTPTLSAHSSIVRAIQCHQVATRS